MQHVLRFEELPLTREYFYLMDFEELLQRLTRKVKCVEKTFDQYAREQGYPNLTNQMLDGMCAELFFSCTRMNTAEFNKRNRGRKALTQYRALQAEYTNAIRTGEINTWTEEVALNREKECDIAHARIAMRRSCQIAKRRGKPIPENNICFLG